MAVMQRTMAATPVMRRPPAHAARDTRRLNRHVQANFCLHTAPESSGQTMGVAVVHGHAAGQLEPIERASDGPRTCV
jgi:hypothetical protein